MDRFESIASSQVGNMQSKANSLVSATGSSSLWNDDVQAFFYSLACEIKQCVCEIEKAVEPISKISSEVCVLPYDDECKAAGSILEKAKSISSEARKVVSGD